MEIMWDIPFYPWTKSIPDICHVQPFYKPWAEIPTYHKPWPRVRMYILALERKRKRKKREKRRKFPIKNRKKAKERKFSIKDRKKTEEICRKVFGLDNIWTIQNCHQVNKKKKGNHDLKWSSPFDCQPKSSTPANFSPRTKQKQKRKRPKTFKAKIPTKNTIPKK